MNRAVLTAALLLLPATLTSCASKRADMSGVAPTYRASVQAGRLTPAAARSLRGSAPQVDMMDAYVDRVEKARAKINAMPISETEKRHLIRAEMRSAGKEWQHKLTPNKSL